MADQKKGSDLPLADLVGDNDVFFGIRKGVTTRMAAASLRAYVLSDLSNPSDPTKGSALVGYKAPGAGSVDFNVKKTLDTLTVTPEQYGAKGDGVTDDTAAFTAALATGASIQLSEKTYVISSGLTITVTGQTIKGKSLKSILKCNAGTYDIITFAISAGSGCGISNMRIDAVAMTGGWTIFVNNSNVCTIANVRGVRGWNGIKVSKANTTVIMNTQMALYRGEDLFYGDGRTERSDIVKIFGLTLTADETIARPSRPRGFTIDGDFNTIQAFALLVLQARTGIRHLNTAGTAAGGFARYYDAELEFTNDDVVRVESGQDIHFTDCYVHGSVTGMGLFVGPSCGNVSFKGGKISGNFTYGLFSNGAGVRINGALVGGNSGSGSGQYSAIVGGPTAKRLNVIGCETGLNDELATGTSNHKYGFEAQAGAVDCNFIGGSLRGNATGEWIDNSGGAFGNVRAIGYSGDSAPSDRQYSAVVPASGGSFQVLNTAPTVALNPAATLASFTVVLPTNPKDGQEVRVGTKLAITALTVSPGTVGHAVNSPPTTLAAGGGFSFIWRNSSLNWFRLY